MSSCFDTAATENTARANEDSLVYNFSEVTNNTVGAAVLPPPCTRNVVEQRLFGDLVPTRGHLWLLSTAADLTLRAPSRAIPRASSPADNGDSC